MIDALNITAYNLGLTINVSKSDVLFQPLQQLEVVKDYIHIGSTASNDKSLDKEIQRRIGSGATAFGKPKNARSIVPYIHICMYTHLYITFSNTFSTR